MAWQDYIGSYSLQYVPANVIEELRGSHNLGIFFRLATDPPLHLWAGVNDIPAGIDSVDEDGTVYLGAGRLLNIPTLETLVNGQSDSVEFGISGIDPETADRMRASMPPVRGKEVTVGITTLDTYYQPMSSIIRIWTGVASHTTEAIAPVSGSEKPTVSLSLATVSGNNTRSRPSLVMWSSAHHKAMFPGDKFCDQTARLARGRAPVWPNY